MSPADAHLELGWDLALEAVVAALGLKDRVRLRLEEDHVGIWPDISPAGAPAKAGYDEIKNQIIAKQK